MPVVGVRELSRKLSWLLEEVERTGEPLLVTRHGRPIAAVMPVDAAAVEALLTRGVGRLARRPRSAAELPPPVPQVLRELREGLERIYGDRLRGLHVFGSYARGEADPVESDLDVAILLDEASDHDREIERTSELITQISLRHEGLPISRLFLSEADWTRARTRFIRAVRAEGKPA